MGRKNSQFDVVIAGGGPAGLSALLWCADLGLDAILLEQDPEFGGQLLLTHNAIQNYLGVETANGRGLRDIFLRQVEKRELNRRTGARIVEADLTQRSLFLSDGTEYSGRSIIIGTGVRRRKLMVPGEDEFRGRGILESGKKAVDEMKGKTVVIIGGGDAALENALILSASARKVLVVHRRREFTARSEFLHLAERSKNIDYRLDTRITNILGKEGVEAVELAHLSSGKISRLQADAVLIRIGVEPNTYLFRGQIALDEAGYITIDARCAADLPNIFAVGDVTNRIAPTIAAAVGQGSIAAKAIFAELRS